MVALRHGPRPSGPHITPADFASKESEKTKLNWFLFEYALELEKSVRQNKKLRARLRRKGVDDEAMAGFCVHFSKQMEGEILKRLSGQIANVGLNYQPIEAYFPTIGDALVDQLLTKAAEAWDSQTEVCTHCPTRCISEKEQRATMFDDPDYQ